MSLGALSEALLVLRGQLTCTREAEAMSQQCYRRKPRGNLKPAQKQPTFTNNVPAVFKLLPLEPGVQHLLGTIRIPGLGIQCGAAVVGCHAVVGAAGKGGCQRPENGMVNNSSGQINEEGALLTLFARGDLWEQAALARRPPHLQPSSPSAALPVISCPLIATCVIQMLYYAAAAGFLQSS